MPGPRPSLPVLIRARVTQSLPAKPAVQLAVPTQLEHDRVLLPARGTVSEVEPLQIVGGAGHADAVRREVDDELAGQHLDDVLGESYARHVANGLTQSGVLLQHGA